MADKIINVKGVEFKMIKVEGGEFFMGSRPEQKSDDMVDPYHVCQVILSDYYIGETLVTQELWKAVMGSNPSEYTSNPKNPVEHVSWEDIVDVFIPKLNELTGKKFYLPTEAQWEFAARGGNKSRHYEYSGSNDIDEVAWYSANAKGSPHPVGEKLPNELGIYDMTGNLLEWCRDYYNWKDSYRYVKLELQRNPVRKSKSSQYHILRGGGCYSCCDSCYILCRDRAHFQCRGYSYGFRLAARSR